MPALVTVLLKGERVSVCDARCYNAEWEDTCECICQGFNHGAGESQARSNTLKHFDDWRRIARQQYGDGVRLKCHVVAVQPPLRLK